ncbi:MAG: CoA-binding protein [Candidatus Aenigmarchaeota archaeon]|nr:CoA-binding protein [Candidatus Aenigmarchaeota archaeon]
MNQLDYFFKPKSVAIVGASRDPKKIGHVIFRNFVEGKFAGKIFPINPNAEELFGHRCYPSVLSVEEKIDLAVITIPAPIVPQALEECGKKKIPAVIIISGGFKEIGNVELENEVSRILKKHKIRAIGPNCIGALDPYSGVDTFFLPRYKLERPGKGKIAFISQSGALGSVVLDWMAMKGYKISKFISYGNAVDVDEADLTEYLANDKETDVICAYFEGVKEGRKFYDVAKKISSRKPLIVLKGGTTSEGTSAVASHTGSLAGSAEIYSTAFKQAGVIQAKDLEQIFDFARVLSTQPAPKGNRVQIITDGGGYGVMTTDWLIKNGLQLAKMSHQNIEKIKKACPPHVVVKNPIDLTGDADTERYKIAIESAMEDPNVDMVAVIILFQIPTLTPDIVDVVSAISDRKQKPLIVLAAGGRYTEVLKKSLEDFGVPCFSYPEGAAEALRALYEYGCCVNAKGAKR